MLDVMVIVSRFDRSKGRNDIGIRKEFGARKLL